MRYFSTFTGVGGFELGIGEKAECVGFSEIDKYASAVLKYRFPNIKNYGDIKEINWSEVPDFDLLVGGSPCQDLSVAGKRAGITGERSGLFAEFIRALQEKKPQYFIWENVKGALSSNQGWDFAEVQAQMAECGYELWWQVLNAKDFGVPQNRERIFVIGVRGGSPREVFFEREADAQDSSRVSYALDANYHKGTNTLKKGRRKLVQRQPLRFLKRNQKNIEGDYAFCLDASQTSGVRIDRAIRRLTPLECERLMSWPDDWTAKGILNGEVVSISDTQRYKMCGNGVVSEVVKHMIETVGDGGGLIIAPTHVLEPEVPLDNIRMFLDAIDRYGHYN